MSKNLAKSTSLVSLMTFFSRVLGFLRDMIVARLFGVNAGVDAFLVAFKLPNFMRSLFAEGSFSQAFVPTLAHYKHNKSPEEIRKFVAHTAGCLSAMLLVITMLAVIFMPLIIKIIAPGFDPYRFQLAVYMTRITFPYLMLISLTAFVGSILNSYGKFGIPAFAPAILNIILIIAALFFSHFFTVPIESQAWGILIAGFLQLAFQLPFLKEVGFLRWPKFNFKDEGVRRILKLMVPALFGASIVQIGLLINTIFASFLKTGSITWLYFSERLAYFPQGVFGVALATVILPHLSKHVAQKSPGEFLRAMDWGLRCNILIGLPAALTMGILSGPLITTLFDYGRFNQFDVLMTQRSVIAYAVGLLAFMLIKILSTGFYAHQNIKTPVKIGVAAVLFNILLNAVLIGPLQHAGLALATSLSSCFNVLLLIYFLYKHKIFKFQSGWGIYLLQLFAANLAIIIFFYFEQGTITTWLVYSAGERIEHLSYLLLTSMIIYLMVLGMCGLRLRHFTVRGT
ncbi:MAG TPA: murein biosynthesis integral membrane protein MurJ [Gammaproteobacteria bacterium]|nr:murein biosynthesis integral membrane protein MurJ [Gammaproteobacteria bacterium]